MLVAGYSNYLGSGSNLNVRPQNASSSVITISSTSSSSSVSSGDSKYNLLKSVKDSIKNGTEIIKNTFLSKISNTISGTSSITSKNLTKINLVTEESIAGRSDTSSSDDDVDSLKSELIHFKPIVSVPKTPNSSSKHKILRVPSIRPKSEASNPEIFSPCTSPFIPIDPKSPRKSAFSIVTVQEEESSVEQKSDVSPSEEKIKGKRGRKRKTDVIKEKCDKKASDDKIKSPNGKKSKQEETVVEQIEQNVRVTRNRKNADNSKRLSQEEIDFEFAKKLDEKLNHNLRGKKANLKSNNSAGKSKAVVEVKRNYNTRSRRN